jgi:hypothetical protein
MLPLALVLLLAGWGARRVGRARREICEELARQQLRVVRMRRRHMRLGPFADTTSRAQLVYHVDARDASGSTRILWTRWGRSWLRERDTLELRPE